MIRLFRFPDSTALNLLIGALPEPDRPKRFFHARATEPLQEFIRSCLPTGEWILEGWRQRSPLGWHDHCYPGNVWSGTYYPSDGNGTLEFESGECLSPTMSTLIVFPSTLKHRVIGEGRRLVVAFNARSNFAGKPALTEKERSL